MEKDKNFKIKAEKLKAIAHKDRLCIVHGLIRKSCTVTDMQSCLNMPQSTVSQHIAKLKSANIIDGKRNGTEIIYRVIDEDIINLIEMWFPENK